MQRKCIHIQALLPNNIDDKHIQLYTKKSTYSSPILKVKRYNNIFVSHEGLCFKYFRLLPYSTFNINSSYDAKHGWEFFRLAAEQYYVSTFGKSLKKLRLSKDKVYAVIHTKWFNYSFWMTSSLVRLRMLYASGYDFTLLYPEEWDAIPYVKASLRAFPDLKIERIPVGVHVQVPQLLLPEVRPFTACLNADDTHDVSQYLIDFYRDAISRIQNTPQKLFVNRRKASCRKMVNEQETRSVFDQYGYVEVDFDDLSFVEQMAYMQGVSHVAMLHGAGMTNVMFAKPGTKVLEIMHEYTEPRTYRFIYWFLTVQNNCDYYVQFCKTVDTHADEWRKDVIVDCSTLTQNIKMMEE